MEDSLKVAKGDTKCRKELTKILEKNSIDVGDLENI